MLNKCDSCRHEKVLVFDKPCRDCVIIDFVDGVKFSNWKPKEPKIPTDREILWKNSVPGSDIKPGRPSPYLVGAKKSKWRKVEDGIPKDVCKAYMVWDNNPDAGCIKLHCNVEFNGWNFVCSNGYVLKHVTHYRYMPKPPKEYRK